LTALQHADVAVLTAVMALLPVENADEGEQDADEHALGAYPPGLQLPLQQWEPVATLRMESPNVSCSFGGIWKYRACKITCIAMLDAD